MSSAEVLRHVVKSATARSALLKKWNPLRKETAKSTLSLADFRKQIPRALASKKELGLGGGLVQDPVLQLFQ